MLKNPVFGFDAKNQSSIPGVQNPQPQNVGQNANVDVSAVLAQNGLLMQQIGDMSKQLVIASKSPEQVAPVKPDAFDINDIYNQETPSGKFYQADRDYRDTEVINKVANIFNDKFNNFEQKNAFDNRLNALQNEKQIPADQMAGFQKFIEQPNVDMNVLYDLYVTKNQNTNFQPVSSPPQNVPIGTPPVQEHPLSNPNVQPIGTQPPPTGTQPPPIASAPSPNNIAQQPMSFGQQVAQTAKSTGMV